MRTPHLAHAALALFFLTARPGAALADFKLGPEQPPEGIRLSEESVGLPSRAPDRAAPLQPPSLPLPRFRVAQGFGRQVSLGFAARQIVPAAVAVRFGSGIDPASTVDWTGGQPWNRALAAAVQPLGLRIVTGATSVMILR